MCGSVVECITEREGNKMKKYTTVIWNKDNIKKIIRNESKPEAFIIANEEKLKGNRVEVVDDFTCEIIYK